MNKPLRIGLIGAGMVSRHHLIAWAAIPDQAKVVAVTDPSPTGPEDNLRTLQLVEDCYRLSGWEAPR
jgi:predicted dehydrogenase